MFVMVVQIYSITDLVLNFVKVLQSSALDSVLFFYLL